MEEKSSEKRGAPAQLLAQGLGLLGDDGRYGPSRHVAIRPDDASEDLAKRLAFMSLEPLRRAAFAGESLGLVHVPDMEQGRGVYAKLPTTLPPALVNGSGFTIGLPLLVSLCPALEDVAIRRLIPRRLLPQENLDRPARADLGFELVQLEADLWAIAERFGGLSRTMPFATRIRALRWWWEPRKGRTPRPTICIRCGCIMFTRALRSRFPAPYCAACTKSPLLQMPGAVAPAERGTWWLRCHAEGCSIVFLGRAQARRCPDCRSSRQTRSKRRPLVR